MITKLFSTERIDAKKLQKGGKKKKKEHANRFDIILISHPYSLPLLTPVLFLPVSFLGWKWRVREKPAEDSIAPNFPLGDDSIDRVLRWTHLVRACIVQSRLGDTRLTVRSNWVGELDWRRLVKWTAGRAGGAGGAGGAPVAAATI